MCSNKVNDNTEAVLAQSTIGADKENIDLQISKVVNWTKSNMYIHDFFLKEWSCLNQFNLIDVLA